MQVGQNGSLVTDYHCDLDLHTSSPKNNRCLLLNGGD